MRLLLITVLSSLVGLTSGCNKDKDDKSDTKSDTKSGPSSEKRPDTKTSDEGKASDTEFKRYKMKSGIIEYQVSGMQTGTETLYFDDWGWIEATYTNVELNIAGHKSKDDSVKILDKDYSHSFDVTKRTGVRVANPLAQLIEGAKRQGKDMTDVGMEMMKNMGGKKVGTETVAGHECDVYEMKSLKTKTWIYNGLTLKTESSMANTSVNKVATKAEFDVDVPKEKFAVPDDVKFRDVKIPGGL